jgi:hypothetical protein
MTDTRESWEQDGSGRMTDAQRRMFNACCGDLAEQIVWHGGHRLSKEDWRHMISGTMLGWRVVTGIFRGEGAPGLVMLGGSSLRLSKTLAKDAITCALNIGDHPDEQGLQCQRVRWCDAVLRGLGYSTADLERVA